MPTMPPSARQRREGGEQSRDHWGGDRSERKLDGEGRPALGPVGHVQARAMRLRDGRRDRQTEARAALLRGEKRLEDLLAKLGRDTRATVCHRHRDRLAFVHDGDAERASGRSGFMRVHEEIQKQLLEILVISKYAVRRFAETDTDDNALFVEGCLHEFERLRERRPHVDGVIRSTSWMRQRTEAISGSVRATPSAALASNGALRQCGSDAAVRLTTPSAASPVSRSAARLNIATRPAELMAATPLSIVATMFSMYSFASTTCAYRRAFLIAIPAWFASVISRSRSCE